MLKILTLIVCLLPLTLQAADDSATEQAGWKGEGALGFTSTSGNTDSENLNASLGIAREVDRWKHSASIELIRNEVDGETSADSQVLKLRSERGFGEKSYWFGQLRHEEDEFSGYDSQSSVSLGAGSRFIENDKHLLDASIGVGYRSLEASDSGDSEEDAIVTGNLLYEYKISETATFSEAILVESGDENTHTESDTALKMTIEGNLAAKISYLVKHNSDVPDGTDKSDEITTISLVYGF